MDKLKENMNEIRMFLLDLSRHCPSSQWQKEGEKYLKKIVQIIALLPDKTEDFIKGYELGLGDADRDNKETKEEVRKAERERIMGIIESISSIGYPYGGDYKYAIQQALKEE